MDVIYLGIEEKEVAVRRVFERVGIDIQFLPVQRYVPLAKEAVRQAVSQLPEDGWLVFSSAFTVQLMADDQLSQILPLHHRSIAVVGDSTYQALRRHFPDVQPQITASHFQKALENIARTSGAKHHVVHLTSKQSFTNIHPVIPENVILQRIPVYQLEVNQTLAGHRPPKSGERASIWVVPSPSAINAAVALWGKTVLQLATQFITPGRTTANYLAQHYHIQRIQFPERPDLPRVAALVANILKDQDVKEIP